MPDRIPQAQPYDNTEAVFNEWIMGRHAEIKSLEDLTTQRGTPTPAMFNQFYKFVQNPSTVSVETYKRMIDTDDTVGSGIDFLTTALTARMGAYEHPNDEITEWVNKALSNIKGGWTNSVKELLSAVWAGFSVDEIVWENGDLGFTPAKLVPLPPTTVLFELDFSGELTEDGILQYQRFYSPSRLPGGVGSFFGFLFSPTNSRQYRPDPYAKLGDFPFALRTGNLYSYMAVRIPKQKCIHYSFDAQGKFQNPYGRSLLRRAYKYWVMKDAFLQMLATALDRKGTPLTIVYADPNTTLIDPNKTALESAGAGAAGRRDVGIRADKAARDAFQNVHNDTTIILPGKKGQIFDVDPIQQNSNHDGFIAAIKQCDQGIMRALLLPSLIFTGGDGSGSFALGQEHAKTFDKICDGILAGFKQTITDQLIDPLLRYNFPESVWKKDGFGTFGKRELSIEEIEKEMQAVGLAIDKGVIDMNDLNDYNKVRNKIGFEPKDKVPEREVMEPFGGEEEETDEGSV